MSINEFNRRITVNKYIFGQDASGGNIKALSSFFDVWAKLENMNGSRYMDNLQTTYSKAFKITTRYEASRTLNNVDEIVYEGNVYILQSISQIEEGRRNLNVIIAYTTGSDSNTGDVVYRVAKYLKFNGDGAAYTITDDQLIGWTILLVFRDGMEYRIVNTTPSGKQVNYDKEAGTLSFDHNIVPLQLTDQVDVYLIN